MHSVQRRQAGGWRSLHLTRLKQTVQQGPLACAGHVTRPSPSRGPGQGRGELSGASGVAPRAFFLPGKGCGQGLGKGKAEDRRLPGVANCQIRQSWSSS